MRVHLDRGPVNRGVVRLGNRCSGHHHPGDLFVSLSRHCGAIELDCDETGSLCSDVSKKSNRLFFVNNERNPWLMLQF